jgi:WD40 repeat protein
MAVIVNLSPSQSHTTSRVISSAPAAGGSRIMTAASPPFPAQSHHLNASAPPYTPPPQQQQQKQTPAKTTGVPLSTSSASLSSSSSTAAAASSSSQPQPLLPAVSLQSLLSSSLSPSDRVDVCNRYFSSPSCRSRELVGHRRPVRCLRWNAAGSRLASAGVDAVIHIWTLHPLVSPTATAGSGGFVPSAALSALELRGHTDSVEQLVWCDAPLSPSASQCQHLLASASLDQTMRIFDTNSQPTQLTATAVRQLLLATVACVESRTVWCCLLLQAVAASSA